MKEKIPKLVKFIVTNQLPFGKSLLKPLSAAYRLTVFAQFHKNLKLLQHFCKTLEGSARYCKILHVVPDLLTVISYLLERHQKSIDTELKKKGMAALLSCAMPF